MKESKTAIFARVSEVEADLLKKVCKLRGEQISDFVRRAIKRELAELSYLSAEEKKALGVKSETENRMR